MSWVHASQQSVSFLDVWAGFYVGPTELLSLAVTQLEPLTTFFLAKAWVPKQSIVAFTNCFVVGVPFDPYDDRRLSDVRSIRRRIAKFVWFDSLGEFFLTANSVLDFNGLTR